MWAFFGRIAQDYMEIRGNPSREPEYLPADRSLDSIGIFSQRPVDERRLPAVDERRWPESGSKARIGRVCSRF